MKKNLRKWGALVGAILLYYVVHEGAHLLAALAMGTFQRIRLVGIVGVQIVADTAAMTPVQIGLFCLAGPLATLLGAAALVGLQGAIVRTGRPFGMALGYYTSLVFLLLDPLYLSLLYPLFGGGDMNGMVLLGLPELALRLFFGAVGLVGLALVLRRVTPRYKAAFAAGADGGGQRPKEAS